ncbi:unnamed protein product [Vitrella brassicaformis CCMP3155]|uniref:Uncharacterized protein n=2 Tax=Vitrella brassicaformis TaxID=1169539 RepID=A0A0G4EKW3_VITBC|nr:unnamed protein product [Vitrella brassicaformis CCMP3155]|eukprot:CEL97101.1 unnamed protein product [Vitrella brassicaformis CCMP3155]
MVPPAHGPWPLSLSDVSANATQPLTSEQRFQYAKPIIDELCSPEANRHPYLACVRRVQRADAANPLVTVEEEVTPLEPYDGRDVARWGQFGAVVFANILTPHFVLDAELWVWDFRHSAWRALNSADRIGAAIKADLRRDIVKVAGYEEGYLAVEKRKTRQLWEQWGDVIRSGDFPQIPNMYLVFALPVSHTADDTLSDALQKMTKITSPLLLGNSPAPTRGIELLEDKLLLQRMIHVTGWELPYENQKFVTHEEILPQGWVFIRTIEQVLYRMRHHGVQHCDLHGSQIFLRMYPYPPSKDPREYITIREATNRPDQRYRHSYIGVRFQDIIIFDWSFSRTWDEYWHIKNKLLPTEWKYTPGHAYVRNAPCWPRVEDSQLLGIAWLFVRDFLPKPGAQRKTHVESAAEAIYLSLKNTCLAQLRDLDKTPPLEPFHVRTLRNPAPEDPNRPSKSQQPRGACTWEAQLHHAKQMADMAQQILDWNDERKTSGRRRRRSIKMIGPAQPSV